MTATKLYITLLLFVKEGEETFHAYEDTVLPFLDRYNGRLLYRIRPGQDAFINSADEKPYEIHLVEFGSKADFENFRQDEERKGYAHLFQQSVKKAILLEGHLG